MAKKKVSKAEKLKALAEENGWSFRASYSGRGMLGSTCIGIVGGDLERMREECWKKGFTGSKYDNMGLDWILYFPALKSEAKELFLWRL